jgi:hypothetical protein
MTYATFFMIAFTIYFLIFPKVVYAYLDFGTGSYFFQILISILVAGIFTIKVFWNNIKALFKKLFSKRKNDAA